MGYVDSGVPRFRIHLNWRVTGLVSKQIVPYAKSILGVDVSQEMVDLYNKTGEEEGFGSMKAVRAELKGEDGELNGQKFDVIVVSSALPEGGSRQNLTPVVNSAPWRITISKTSER